MKNLLGLILLFYSHVVFADTIVPASRIPIAPYGAEILNYTDPNEILKNKKLELGIRLSDLEMSQITNFLNHKLVKPQQKLNPFLEWDLDVEVLFTHLETGATSVIDAFYFRDYVRDTVINDWADKQTEFPFHVRFAPTEAGNWTYQMRVKVRGKDVGGFWIVPFRVIESGAPGFTSVHPNKRNLCVDGKIIFPVGQNLISPVSGVDNYGVKPNETAKAARVDDWLNYHKDVQMFHEQGGDFIRFVQTAWSSLIEFEEKGNYYDRLHYAWEQDRLLEYCESNGMRMNFNFMFQEPIMNFGQYSSAIWDFGHNYLKDDGTYGYYETDPYKPYCYNDTGKEEPHNMFLDEEDLRYHQQRMRYYISRYGYSTSIMVFEFLSEPFHLDQYYPKESSEMKNNEQGRVVRNALLNYNRRMSEYIKDSLGHHAHLIGVHAFDNTIYWQDEEAKKIIDESCKLPSIDVVGFSTYKNEPNRLLISKQERGTNVEENENSYYRKITDFWALYEKPIMHFEQGSTGDGITNPNASSDFTPHQLDVRTVGFTGCAGLFVWEGFIAGPDFDLKDVWKSTAVAGDWMNSDSVIQVLTNSGGNWSQGRQAERHDRSVSGKTKETEYYISEDQKHAVGFVLNRTANSYTMAKNSELQAKMGKPQDSYRSPRDIRWDDGGKQLYASSLMKKSMYKITWYDAYTQSVISEVTAKTTRKGEFKLEFPELIVESKDSYRPVVWYTLSVIE